MVKLFSVMLLAFAISTPAHAEIFGFLSSNGGPEQVMNGNAYAPAPHAFGGQPMQGYPFYSGCCDPNATYGDACWDGYCGAKGCGMKAPRVRHHGGMKGGCECGGGCAKGGGHSTCGQGGCGGGDYKFGVIGYGGYGYAAPYQKGGAYQHGGAYQRGPYQYGGKSSWPGRVSYRGMGGKGGCGGGAPCGGKGCETCDPCAPKHCRWGLFDWMHFGRGHGCDVCGGAGCSSCDGGKGSFGKGDFGKGDFGQGDYIEQAPLPGYEKSYYGTPTEAHEDSLLPPPEVLVEPTSVSDRSAWRRPANPFARPLSY